MNTQDMAEARLVADRILGQLHALAFDLAAAQEIVAAHAALPLAADQNGRFYCVACSSHYYNASGPSRDIAHTPTCSVLRARTLKQQLEQQPPSSHLAPSG